MRITAWNVDPRSFVRPPVGIDHVVIDTPGGLTGLDLARVVMYADALVVPIGASIFDRESAAACLAELRTLPRVASGRCRIGAIGMRVEAHSDAAEALLGWSHEQKLQILAVLPQSSAYVRCIDKGLTLFDLPLEEIEADLAHWKPLLQWLRPLVRPAANASEAMPGSAHAAGTPMRLSSISRRRPQPSSSRSRPQSPHNLPEAARARGRRRAKRAESTSRRKTGPRTVERRAARRAGHSQLPASQVLGLARRRRPAVRAPGATFQNPQCRFT